MSTCQNNPLLSPSKKRGRKRAWRSNNLTQTIIDAGQSRIGLEHCSECGMTYNVDVENDIKLHNDFHNRYNSTKPFHLRSFQVEGWKKHVKFVRLTNRLVGTLFVVSDDSNCVSIKRKIEQIIKEYVNVDLGFCNDVPIWKPKRSVLLFVTSLEISGKAQQFIAGIALVDPVEKIRFQPGDILLKPGKYIGINRLWVQQTMRRKGLATLLTNIARSLLYPDVPMSEVRAAFYQPEGDGLEFVLTYFGRRNGRYLTYEED